MTDTRRALLRTARERFLSRGFAATSMDEIRRAAEVSNGSLFHHFPTKNHLARALYLEALASFHARLLAALDGVDDVAAGVTRLVHAHLDWVVAARDDARVLTELRDQTAIDGAPIDGAQVNAEAFAALQAFIARGVAAGRMLDLPFAVWMALVFGPALELTRRWLAAPPAPIPRAVRAALARAAALAVQPDGALAAPPPPPPPRARRR